MIVTHDPIVLPFATITAVDISNIKTLGDLPDFQLTRMCTNTAENFVAYYKITGLFVPPAGGANAFQHQNNHHRNQQNMTRIIAGKLATAYQEAVAKAGGTLVWINNHPANATEEERYRDTDTMLIERMIEGMISRNSNRRNGQVSYTVQDCYQSVPYGRYAPPEEKPYKQTSIELPGKDDITFSLAHPIRPWSKPLYTVQLMGKVFGIDLKCTSQPYAPPGHDGVLDNPEILSKIPLAVIQEAFARALVRHMPQLLFSMQDVGEYIVRIYEPSAPPQLELSLADQAQQKEEEELVEMILDKVESESSKV